MSLLVVGSMAFDAIETPFGKRDKIVGGAGTFIALSASLLVPKVNVVSVVGGDFPAEFMQDMNRRGIDTQGVQIKQNEKSFFWSGRYHLDLNTRDTLITDLNVLADFNPIVPAPYFESEFVMLGNLSPSVQKSVIQQLPKRPTLIAMDTMNFWMNATPTELAETIALVDLLFVNDEEARQLSGEYSLVKAAKKIFEMGPKYLVIKKGEHGALVFNKETPQDIFFAPALPLESVFDPTGAGDTFAGGCLGYLASKGNFSFSDLKQAVIYGSALASFCVEQFGTEKLITVTAEQLNERLQQFKQLTAL